MSKDLEWLKGQDINGSWQWGSQFAGVKLSCNYFVFDIMSRIIDENPQIQLICEIGSHTGGMAIYLSLEALRKKLPFHTFEKDKQITRETNDLLEKLGANMHIYDVFEYPDKVIAIIQEQPAYLICDGGRKHAELEKFIGYLKPGSVVSCHDYPLEINDSHFAPLYERAVPIRTFEWSEKNAQFSSWKIIK